jgi:hypothetical protein
VDVAIVDTQPMGQDPIAALFDANRIRPASSRKLPDPTRLGRRIAALYESWQDGAMPDMPALACALLRRHGIAADSPLARTCIGAAGAVAAWGGLPYHSALHHAEVATNAMVLVELADRLGQKVDAHATALLLAACLSHDLHYRASVARERFAAESVSAAALDQIAAACGCGDADRQALHALVIATEPGLRLRDGGPLGLPLDPAAARLLGRQSVEPELAALAAILSDADLLSSVGLTVGWYRVQQSRLEREADRPYDAGESTQFFTEIVGPDFLSAPGRVLSANLAAIRRLA